MSDLINIEIAGINFSIRCRDSIILQDSDPAYTSFLKTEKDPSAIDIPIALKLNPIPDTHHLAKIFDSGQSWSMFKNGNDYVVMLNPPAFEKNPLWVAKFDYRLKNVAVYLGDLFIHKRNSRSAVSNPVKYPLDQILLMYFLSQREGALIHAAGIGINGKGYIFPGKSGAGKSTISLQFLGEDTMEMLSDDRVIIRKIDGTFRAFGTPWPGEGGIAANRSIPLYGIFFISHAEKNMIREITPRKAIEKLMPVTSIPWFDKDVMPRILNFCDDIISNIPAYELFFKPDREIADVFEKFLSL